MDSVGLYLLVDVEESHNGDIAQLVASLEEGDLDDEEETDKGASKLLNQVASSCGRTAY